ncbi:ATP-binding protein [Aquimarina rhabdastrellae]
MDTKRNMFNKMTNRKLYMIYGIIFGFMFPLLAYAIEVVRLGLNFSLESYVFIHKTIPVHYIIDTAPFFLGLFAYIAGYHLDKVEDSNDKLKKASKYKEIFFTNMSHEIRTPMQGIIGMIDILIKDENLNSDQKQYIQTIEQSSKDLLAILNDILDLSKLEADQMRIYNKPMNLKNTLLKIHRLFSAIMKQKGITFIMNYDDKIPQNIIADPLRITQIISNLVGNAVKFTEKGEIALDVVLHKSEPDLNIRIDVKDEGKGISEQDQKYIFDSFKQAKSNFNTIQGTGLGLTISQKLARLMGGAIEVKSILEKGSTFSFRFKAQKLICPEGSIENEDDIFDFNKRVLLVDDSKINQKVIGLLLQKLGCTVILASDGVEAFNKVKTEDFDMVFMDINMPRLNGYEAAKLIKEHKENAPIVIGLSANVMTPEEHQENQNYLDDYLTKPLTIKILSKKLEKWFKD